MIAGASDPLSAPDHAGDDTRVTCYFDYTCGYSYKAWRWLDPLASNHTIEVDWRPFLLKEVNLEPGEISYFEGDRIESVALLALALSLAAKPHRFAEYHERMFRAMHERDDRPDTDGIYRIAGDVGLEIAAFRRDERTWIQAVAAEHRIASEKWGVFGTPTLVIQDAIATYVKLDSVPKDPDGLWDALKTLALSHPELVEMKRPRA